MSRYSKVLNQSQTQQQPILGRKDMIKNNAGGYVFGITSKEQLDRFLLCGTLGGTYYVSESKLTLENTQTIVGLIQIDGQFVLTRLKELCEQKRILKYDTALYVLSLICTFADQAIKNQAYKEIKTICKTSTQLFTFVGNINDLRGWSKGLRKGVAAWYTSKTVGQVGYQLAKYRQRNGYTHRDVLRLSHPSSTELNEVFKYAVGKKLTTLENFPQIL